jgi:hypothetical protein
MKFYMATLLILASLAIISTYCMAETYEQKIGPFTIQLTSDETVKFIASGLLVPVANGIPVTNEKFTRYDAFAKIGGKDYQIEIQDYDQLIDINLAASIMSFPLKETPFDSWETSEVGGKPGLIAITKVGTPSFFAAYSPDGVGNSGTVIVVIDTITDEKNFKGDKAIFENMVKAIRIFKTG